MEGERGAWAEVTIGPLNEAIRHGEIGNGEGEAWADLAEGSSALPLAHELVVVVACGVGDIGTSSARREVDKAPSWGPYVEDRIADSPGVASYEEAWPQIRHLHRASAVRGSLARSGGSCSSLQRDGGNHCLDRVPDIWAGWLRGAQDLG